MVENRVQQENRQGDDDEHARDDGYEMIGCCQNRGSIARDFRGHTNIAAATNAARMTNMTV
jgi:hypothetical protein